MVHHRIVITGVTSGSGLALAIQYIKDGHTVIGCGRNKNVIETLASAHAKDGHIFKVVDVADKAQVKTFAEEITSSIGAPTFLINNAGVSTSTQNLWEMPIDAFDNVIDINVKGMFYVTHSFLPSMLNARSGIIINLSSGWGRYPGKGQSAYCCSKFGVEGMSKVLALELPPPMACIPFDPGMMNTQMLAQVFDESHAKRMRTPEQWASEVGDFILHLDRNSNGKSITAP